MSIIPGYPVPEQLWVSDSDSCANCGELFALRTMKINCPNCGQLLCANCVTSCSPIVIDGPVESICSMCMEMIEDFVKENNIVWPSPAAPEASKSVAPEKNSVAALSSLPEAAVTCTGAEEIIGSQVKKEVRQAEITKLSSASAPSNGQVLHLQGELPISPVLVQTTEETAAVNVQKEKELENLRVTVQQLESCAHDHQARERSAVEQLEKSRTEYRNQVEILQTRLAAAQQHIVELESPKTEESARQSTVEEDNQVEELTRRLQGIEQECEALRTEKAAIEGEVQRLQQQVQEEKKRRSAMVEDRIIPLQTELQKACEKVKHMEVDHVRLVTQEQTLSAENRRLEAELDNLTASLRNAQEEITHLKEAASSSANVVTGGDASLSHEDGNLCDTNPFVLSCVKCENRNQWSQPSIIHPIQLPTADQMNNAHFSQVRQLPSSNLLFEWGYDTMEASKQVPSILQVVAHEAVQRWDLFKQEAELQLWHRFVAAVEFNYRDNPYHSAEHAADVLQTLVVLIESSGLILTLTRIEKLAAVFAAVVHDVRHPGRTQAFLRSQLDPLYIFYGGEGVLERMHVSTAFQLLAVDSLNFGSGWSADEALDFVDTVSPMIAATDMSKHSAGMEEWIRAARCGGLNTTERSGRLSALRLMLHAADLSNQAKGVRVALQWTGVLKESQEQRTEEQLKGFTPSFLPASEGDAMLQGQIGFIEMFVFPLYDVMQNLFPSLTPLPLERLRETHQHYAKKLHTNIIFPVSRIPVSPATPAQESGRPTPAQLREAAQRMKRTAEALARQKADLELREDELRLQQKEALHFSTGSSPQAAALTESESAQKYEIMALQLAEKQASVDDLYERLSSLADQLREEQQKYRQAVQAARKSTSPQRFAGVSPQHRGGADRFTGGGQAGKALNPEVLSRLASIAGHLTTVLQQV